jgi:hypothetical protein
MDPIQIVAEMRAAELMNALQQAIDGMPHWRRNATDLLDEIGNLVLPELSIEALREADARKRAAEILEDACNGGSCVY